MIDWYEIFDIYESNDCDSLCEIAGIHSDRLVEYFMKTMSKDNAILTTHDIAIYFIEIDNFFDGGESDVYEYVFGSEDYYYRAINDYRQNGGKAYVERIVRELPSYMREEVGRFGCAILAGRGYIRDEEREIIMRLG